jgi:hypothetical protein
VPARPAAERRSVMPLLTGPRIALLLVGTYAAVFAVSAWTAEPPDDGPGALAVMVVGFLLLAVYGFALLTERSWHRRRAQPRGFPVEPAPPRDEA